MSSVIELLREHVGKRGEVWDEAYEDIDAAFDGYLSGRDGIDDYDATAVYTEFEEGGRWTNLRTDVYRIDDKAGETAYFSLLREVPATEMQDGMPLNYVLDEVAPIEVTVTRYVPKPKEAV